MCENNRFKELSVITSRLSSIYNLNDTLLENILKDVLVLIGTDIGCFYVLNRKEKKLEIKSVTGFEREHFEKKRDLGQGLTGQAALDGRSRLVHKEKNISHLSGKRSRIYSEIVVPFKRENEVTGVFVAKSADPAILFKQDDLELMESFADHAAIAVERDKLMQHLHEISRMSLNRNLQELFDYAVEAVHDLTGLAVTLWQVPPDGNALKVKAHHGIQTDYIKERYIPLENSITGAALKENQLIWRRDIQDDQESPKFYNLSEAQKQNWHFFICVPLSGDQNTPLGSLSLYGQKPDKCSDSLKTLLVTFANQVASAIDISKIYGEVINKIKDMSTAVLSESEPEKVLDKICESMNSLMRDTSSCDIFLLDRKENSLALRRNNMSDSNKRFRKREIGEGLIGWAAENKKTVYAPDVSDVSEDKGKKYIKFLETTKSEIAVPMLKGQELVGVLNIEHPDLNAFTENDVKLAEAIANLAALSVRNTENRKSQIESFKRITKSIGRHSYCDIFDIIEHICYITASFMGDDVSCKIKLVNEKENESVPSDNESITDLASYHKRTFPTSFMLEKGDKDHTEMAIPIFGEKKELIGILNIKHMRFINKDIKEIGEAIANLAAIAIKLEKQKDAQIEAVKEICAFIDSFSDLNSVLDKILKTTRLLMNNAFLCEIRSFNPEKNILKLERYSADSDIDLKYDEIPYGEGIVGRVAKNRKTIYIKDVKDEKERYLSFFKGANSEVAAPMLIGEELIGVLNIEHPEIDAFTNSDIKLVEAIANLATVAIKNSRNEKKISNKIKEQNILLEISKILGSEGLDS